MVKKVPEENLAAKYAAAYNKYNDPTISFVWNIVPYKPPEKTIELRDLEKLHYSKKSRSSHLTGVTQRERESAPGEGRRKSSSTATGELSLPSGRKSLVVGIYIGVAVASAIGVIVVLARNAAIRIPPSPVRLKAKDVQTLTQLARDLMTAGRVFATHQVENQTRYAKISHVKGSVYLHSLQVQTLTPGAIILQVDELVPATFPCKVFLNLAWPGTPSRRVSIQLTTDTPLGRQFILMSTGQQGPSYLNTVMREVLFKGELAERVVGGDYKTNDGEGGTALLPHLDQGEYRKSRRVGTMFGVKRKIDDGEPVLGTQFGIMTRDMPDDGPGVPYVFGKVVYGLNVVKAAANHSSIKEVTVVDCGVVVV